MGLVASLLALSACAGSLEPGGGGGGTSGGSGGQNGGADAGPIVTTCANAMTVLQDNCTACHNPGADTIYANLDLMSAGVAGRLVGKPASTSTTANGMCGGKGNLLNSGTLPATGILIDKITNFSNPVCGMGMPYAGSKLAQTDLDCLQAWANGLVSSVGP